jgi:excisionase family DNA binding protein
MTMTEYNRTVRKPGAKFFTITEIARRLSVSERTVHRWAAQRDLAVYRFGRSVRVSEVDLRSFLAAHRDEDS